MKPSRPAWIRNPLTIIALFVGLTEIAFSIAFTRAPSSSQSTILVFLIGFPTLCAVAFFITLWFRPGNFYGPSDFRTDEAYLAVNKAVENAVQDTQPWQPQKPTKSLTIPPVTLESVIANLSKPLCWYLLRTANCFLTPDEHFNLMAQHLDQPVKEGPESPGVVTLSNRLYTIGYLGCAWSSYLDLLFRFETNSDGKICTRIPPEIMTLISTKLGLT